MNRFITHFAPKIFLVLGGICYLSNKVALLGDQVPSKVLSWICSAKLLVDRGLKFPTWNYVFRGPLNERHIFLWFFPGVDSIEPKFASKYVGICKWFSI